MPNPNQYIVAGLTSEDIEIDPTASGTVISYAMAIKAGLNVFGVSIMLMYPSRILSYMVTKPSESDAAPAALVQWLGALTCGLAVPLLCAIPTLEERLRVDGQCTSHSALAKHY
jgi:hypothetical protein